MGWRRALTTVIGSGLLALSPCGPSAFAAEPGASLARYDGRDYLLIWPASRPAGVIVFFHTAETEPLALEASAGMLDALAAAAAGRNYAVLAPSALPGGCAQGGELACWNVEAPRAEFEAVDRIISHVEQSSGVSLTRREAVGYGRGARLLLAGFAERETYRFVRIGLVEPELGGMVIPAAAVLGAETLIYFEADIDDPDAVARAEEVMRALDVIGYSDRVCIRARAQAGVYNKRSLADFMLWFERDCRATGAPPVAPTSAAPRTLPIEERPPPTVRQAPIASADPPESGGVTGASEAAERDEDRRRGFSFDSMRPGRPRDR